MGTAIEQYGVLLDAQRLLGEASRAAEAARAAVRLAEKMSMEAKYQFTLTADCTYCGARVGASCIAEPGVNVHRYPLQHGVRYDAAMEICKAAWAQAEKEN